MNLPVHSTVDELLSNLNVVELTLVQPGYGTDSFTEETIRDAENVRFMNNGQMLDIISRSDKHTRYETCSLLTLRGRAAASSKAMVPIRLDARSVMRRVARASRPLSVGLISSCLIYYMDLW